MKKFTAALLSDKQNQDVSKVLGIGFEYLLAGVTEAHSKTQGYKTLKEFNQKNTLSRPVITSYPFFIALSNGHGNSLYNLFSEFYSFSFGPVSTTILKLINEQVHQSQDKQFKFFDIDDTGIEIKDDNIQNFPDLKSKIENHLIEFEDEQIAFKNIAIRCDEAEVNNLIDDNAFTPLFQAINNGISIVLKTTNNLFFDGSLERIMAFSNHYKSLAKRYHNNAAELIKYTEIEPPIRRALYTDKWVASH
ncbi:MAG: hypothetical protein WDO71_17880 [Bacteroidota bacterium]